MPFAVELLVPGFGARVVGLDLTREVPEEIAKALRVVWDEAGVILFEGLGTTPEALLRLSRCFGELEPHPIPAFREPDHPELIRLGNEKGTLGSVYAFEGTPTAGRLPWHTDLAYTTRPNRGALLRMVKKPDHAGQTGWADMAAAYDALDPELAREIEGREGVYVFRSDLDQMRYDPPGVEKLSGKAGDFGSFAPIAVPLVTPHPDTGRKVLNLSTLNIDGILGMDRDAGDALVRRLLDHVKQPHFHYMHDWQVGDMIAWDNRRMAHCTTGHPPDEIRVVQRTTIKGTADLGRTLEQEEWQ